MADPVSFLAAGIGISDVAFRVIKYLLDVKAASKTIEDDIGDLINEVEGLRAIHHELEQEFHENVGKGVLGRKETMLWFNIGQTLKNGQKLTQKLEICVRQIYGDNPSVTGKRNTLIKQHRRRNNSAVINGMRDQIGTHHRMLQMWLSCTIMQSAREESKRQKKQIEELSNTVKDLEIRLEQKQKLSVTSLEPHHQALPNLGLRNPYSPRIWPSLSSPYFGIDPRSSIRMVPPPVKARIISDSGSIEDNLGKISKTKNIYFDIPVPVNELYTGRNAQAEQLAEWLLGGEGQRVNVDGQDLSSIEKRFVIYGIGGIGKTQFCCKFAETYREHFWGVFWVDGSSIQRLKQTFVRNISRLENVGTSEYAALKWLSSQVEPWLLIIDNADDPDLALEDFFPKGEYGHILITTRGPFHNPYGTVGAGFFEFENLPQEEASFLLLKAAGQERPWNTATIDAARNISRFLGCHPLSLVQAGRTLRNNYCKLHDYLDYYKLQRQKMRGKRSELGLSSATVYSTFEICREAIAERDDETSRDALQLLDTFAFLHNENIRFDMLIKAVEYSEREIAHQEAESKIDGQSQISGQQSNWSAWVKYALISLLETGTQVVPVLPSLVKAGQVSKDFILYRSRARAALRMLEQFSLIWHSEEIDSYSVHPLIHVWLRERPGRSLAEQSVWCGAAATLVSQCILLPPLGNTKEDEEIRKYLLPHVEHIRECQEAIDQRQRDKRMGRTMPFPLFGTTYSKHKAMTYVKFSLIYLQAGRFEEAIRLQRVVRNWVTKVSGMEQVNTRRITIALANTMLLLGEVDDAACLQEETLDACSIYLQAESLETLTVKRRLGLSRCAQGRYEDAKRLLEEAVTDLLRCYGVNHEETLEAKDALGKVLTMWPTEGSLREAWKLHSEAVEGMRYLYGHDHERTLAGHENLCMVIVESGDQTRMLEAQIMMTQVLEARRENLGREHSSTLLAMINLSRVKIALGDLKTAKALVEEGVPIAERNYGPNCWVCLRGRSIIAQIWIQQEEWQDAKHLLLDITQRQRAILPGKGRFHPDRLDGLRMLAKVYHALGQMDDCIAVADEALEVLDKSHGSTHPLFETLKEDKKRWMLRIPTS